MTDTQQPREVVAEDFAAVNSGSYAGEEWQARVDLAAMYRLSAHFGYDDTIWNHITMRVPGSEHDFFLNKFGLLYNEVTASNLIKIDAEGNVLEGPADVNTAGFVIHGAIHNDFPQWKVVFHAHVPEALAGTALKDGFQHLVQDTSMLYGDIGYHFLIRRDGAIEPGRDLDRPGAHVKGNNRTTIGIVYTGGICPDEGEPADTRTDAQKDPLFSLLVALKRVFPTIRKISGHRDHPGVRKACPCFDVDAEFGFLFD